VYFGDGTRADVLAAAGAETAKVIVVATDDPDTTLKIVKIVHRKFPNAKLLARAHDRIHAVRLAGEGVPNDAILRETWLSALALGGLTLRALGYAEGDADEVIARLRKRDSDRLAEQITAARDESERAQIVAAITPEPMRGR